MTSNDLENLSLEELKTEKQKTQKSQRNLLVFWTILATIAIVTIIFRLQQEGKNLSSFLPLIVIFSTLGLMLINSPSRKKLKQLNNEIEKRN